MENTKKTQKLYEKMFEKYNLSTNKIVSCQFNNYFNFIDEYSKNIFIVLIIVIGIFIFYLKIHVNMDIKDWNVKKCNPKYLFFSGYVYNDTSLSNSDATINNFIDCTNKISEGKNNVIIDNILGKTVKNIKNKVINFDKRLKKKQKETDKYLNNLEKDINYISLDDDVINSNIENEVEFNTILNSGIYIDHLNKYIKYIINYMKQSLTYLMIKRANNCINEADCKNAGNSDYASAVKINNILKRFGGNNL